MNFREKVKAIVSEAGIKKLTRQLKARPVVPAKDFQAVLGKEAQLKYKKADSAARKAKKSEAGISEDSDAIRWLQAYNDRRKQRARNAAAGAELRKQNTEKKKSKPQPQPRPQHEETGKESKPPTTKSQNIRARQKAIRDRATREKRPLTNTEEDQLQTLTGQVLDAEKKDRVAENSNHPFYQKVKSLSRGKKNNSLLEKKSKTIRLLIAKIKPCGKKPNVDETYTRKWQPGDEPKQTGREPATTPASDKAFKKRQKKFLAGIKKIRPQK